MYFWIMSEVSSTTVSNSLDVDQLLSKAFDGRVIDIISSINLANTALLLAQENNDIIGQANSEAHLAYFFMIVGKHDQARSYADSARSIFEEHNNYSGLGMVEYAVGSTYYKTEDYHLGLKHLINSSLMCQKANDIVGQARALKAIGAIYEFFREYGHAKQTYLKCIELSEQCDDKNGISNAYNNLSGIYLRNEEIDKAISVIEQSILMKQETGDKRGLAFALYGKGKVLAYLEKHETAEKLYLESIEIFKVSKEYVGIMMCHNKLGSLYFAQDNIALAKEHLNKVLEKGNKINHYLIMHKAYYTLYQIEKSERNEVKALEYLELHMVYKDKVINKETKNVIQSIKSISEMEILEREAHWQKEKKEEVELKNAELDTFVYKVSHDLKGPISSLLGLYEIVKIEIKDKNSLHYFELYHSQIQRLHGILMDFIDLTQIKEKKIEPVQLDIKQMVHDCINAHAHYSNFELIDFNIQIDSIDFHSDKSTLNTIFQNLIENAIKYSRNDVSPEVNVKVTKSDNQIEIIVQDNGIGIREEYQPRIFEMFFRANDKVQGSGLGLYILKNAVDKLSGTIDFNSKLNEGSQFQIHIPCQFNS